MYLRHGRYNIDISLFPLVTRLCRGGPIPNSPCTSVHTQRRPFSNFLLPSLRIISSPIPSGFARSLSMQSLANFIASKKPFEKRPSPSVCQNTAEKYPPGKVGPRVPKLPVRASGSAGLSPSHQLLFGSFSLPPRWQLNRYHKHSEPLTSYFMTTETLVISACLVFAVPGRIRNWRHGLPSFFCNPSPS